jgi:hydrogenase maturation protease
MLALVERWKGVDSLILIDAVAPRRTPGAIYRLDASAAPLDRELFNTSTHAFGLADAVELSRLLGTLPQHVVVFGIEAGNLAMGVGLSPEVEVALPGLMNEVLVGISHGLNEFNGLNSLNSFNSWLYSCL